nr:MAG TPA_asm: hypothetical protein [Caudoviricetes sp.]
MRPHYTHYYIYKVYFFFPWFTQTASGQGFSPAFPVPIFFGHFLFL